MFAAVAVALVVSGLCLVVFARYASKHASEVRLGDSTFTVGRSSSLAKKVDQDGPLFFNDLVREDGLARPLVLAHIEGTDWAALNALAPGAKAQCVVRVDNEARTLTDPCSDVVYDFEGIAGGGQKLERFTTAVNPKGMLSVDLNKPYPDALR